MKKDSPFGPELRPSERRWQVNPQEDLKKQKLYLTTSTKITCGLGVVVFLAAVIWYSFFSRNVPAPSQDIPLITRVEGPYKIRPHNPGGVQVPHQDKAVYSRLDPQSSAETVEQLLPGPDQAEPPLDLMTLEGEEDEATHTEKEDSPQKLSSEEVLSNKLNFESWPKATPPHLATKIMPQQHSQPLRPMDRELLEEEEEGEESLPLAQEQAEAPKNTMVERVEQHAINIPKEHAVTKDQLATPKQKEVAKAPSPPLKMPALAPTQKNSNNFLQAYTIQVASLDTPQAAEAEKKRLWEKYPRVFAGLKAKIFKVSLGLKGIKYRILAGPFKTYQEAQTRCKALSQQSRVGCFVVKSE